MAYFLSKKIHYNMDWFIDFLQNNFSNYVWLAILIVSMIPTLESKIAIPLAMNSAIWAKNCLSPIATFFITSIGSILPCIFIILIIRKLKSKTTGFVTSKFFQKYTLKSQTVVSKSSNLKKYITLACFVAVPLPLTGVWTGSLIAGLTNLNIKYCFIAISIGAFISAGVVTLLCTVFSNSISYILMISILLIILFLFADLLISYIKSIKLKHKKGIINKNDK